MVLKTIKEQEQNESNDELKKILLLFFLKKNVIFTFILFFLIMATMYVISTSKLYTAKTDISISTDTADVSPIDSVVSGSFSKKFFLDDQEKLIYSSLILDKVVSKIEKDGYNIKALVETEEKNSTNVFFALWDTLEKSLPFFFNVKSTDTFQDSDIGGYIGEDGLQYSDKIKLRLILKEKIEIETENKSNIFSIKFTWYNALLSKKIANIIAEVYVLDQLEAKYEANKNASVWLNKRLEGLKSDLRTSEIAVERYKTDNKLENVAGTKLFEIQIAKFNEQLVDAKANEEQLLAKYVQVREIVNSQGILALPDSIYTSLILELNSKLLEISRDESELSSKYGDRHPNVINIKAQRRQIEKQIKNETQKMVLAARNDYKVAKSRRMSLANSLEELKRNGGALNKKIVHLRELERELDSNKNLFNAFLERTKEISSDLVLTEADSRIISKALIPIKASHPNIVIIYSIMFFVGLFSGIIFVVIVNLFDVGLYNEKDVLEQLDLNLIGQVPYLAQSKKIKEYASYFHNRKKIDSDIPDEIFYKCHLDPFSNYAEAIRNIRMNVKYNFPDKTSHIMTITSTLPNEGKSTLAMNLAVYAAQTGEKVLLVDGDVRNPALTRKYGCDTKVGIFDHLFLDHSKDNVISQSSQINNLYFASIGSTKNIQYVTKLSSEKIKSYFTEKSLEYDLVIIDSSPIFYTQDTREYMKMSDCVLYAVEWGNTNKNTIASVIHSSPDLKDYILGVVFTKVKTEKSKYYGYYGADKAYEYYESNA